MNSKFTFCNLPTRICVPPTCCPSKSISKEALKTQQTEQNKFYRATQLTGWAQVCKHLRLLKHREWHENHGKSSFPFRRNHGGTTLGKPITVETWLRQTKQETQVTQWTSYLHLILNRVQEWHCGMLLTFEQISFCYLLFCFVWFCAMWSITDWFT